MLRPQLEALRRSLQQCKFALPQGILVMSAHDGAWGVRTTQRAEDDTSFMEYFQLVQRAFCDSLNQP